MMQPNYQHVTNDEFNVVISEDKKVKTQVIAGKLDNVNGKILTQTSVNSYMIDVEENGCTKIELHKNHQALVYLIKGDVIINDTVNLIENKNQLVEFNTDGEEFLIKGNSKSKLLFLSGVPLNEKVTSYGPYVMNTQTEIIEAMRDFQNGKMGFLSR